MDEKELRNMCFHLLNTGWPAYVTTVKDDGYPQTRAMFNLRNKEKFPKLIPFFDGYREDFTLLFTTNTSSKKISDIRTRPAASVYYCIPDDWKGVMFGGIIEIVEDSNLVKTLWQEDWDKYYPKGYDDPDHTVLRINPTIARGWTGSSTFNIDLGDKK